MSKCEQNKDLLELYLQGEFGDAQLAELKEHMHTCQACREEFECVDLMQEVIKDAFLSQTDSEQARTKILSRLNEQPAAEFEDNRFVRAWWTWTQRAAIAAVLLATGLLLGIAVGRYGADKIPEPEPIVAVPISINNLQGTVLVKHQGRDAWHILKANSTVYLGDRFHSTAKSGFTLAMEDSSRVELDQNGMLVLKLYNGETQFFLEHGQCRAVLESPHPKFVVSTPHGRVEALGTEFTVKVE